MLNVLEQEVDLDPLPEFWRFFMENTTSWVAVALEVQQIIC